MERNQPADRTDLGQIAITRGGSSHTDRGSPLGRAREQETEFELRPAISKRPAAWSEEYAGPKLAPRRKRAGWIEPGIAVFFAVNAVTAFYFRFAPESPATVRVEGSAIDAEFKLRAEKVAAILERTDLHDQQAAALLKDTLVTGIDVYGNGPVY